MSQERIEQVRQHTMELARSIEATRGLVPDPSYRGDAEGRANAVVFFQSEFPRQLSIIVPLLQHCVGCFHDEELGEASIQVLQGFIALCRNGYAEICRVYSIDAPFQPSPELMSIEQDLCNVLIDKLRSEDIAVVSSGTEKITVLAQAKGIEMPQDVLTQLINNMRRPEMSSQSELRSDTLLALGMALSAGKSKWTYNIDMHRFKEELSLMEFDNRKDNFNRPKVIALLETMHQQATASGRMAYQFQQSPSQEVPSSSSRHQDDPSSTSRPGHK